MSLISDSVPKVLSRFLGDRIFSSSISPNPSWPSEHLPQQNMAIPFSLILRFLSCTLLSAFVQKWHIENVRAQTNVDVIVPPLCANRNWYPAIARSMFTMGTVDRGRSGGDEPKQTIWYHQLSNSWEF